MALHLLKSAPEELVLLTEQLRVVLLCRLGTLGLLSQTIYWRCDALRGVKELASLSRALVAKEVQTHGLQVLGQFAGRQVLDFVFVGSVCVFAMWPRTGPRVLEVVAELHHGAVVFELAVVPGADVAKEIPADPWVDVRLLCSGLCRTALLLCHACVI